MQSDLHLRLRIDPKFNIKLIPKTFLPTNYVVFLRHKT
jgi:hypothetical protein